MTRIALYAAVYIIDDSVIPFEHLKETPFDVQ